MPLAVTFTDASSESPTSWLWDFGDGDTSTDQNPIHTYMVSGTFTVTLTATNAYGSDSEVKTGYITITKPSVDPLTCTVTPDTIIEGNSVTFQASDGYYAYCYIFPDGTMIYLSSATYIFDTQGVYTVNLSACLSDGSEYQSIDLIITVTDSGIVEFYAKNTRGKAPLTVMFIKEYPDSGGTFLWDFGDGETSIEEHPVHIYTNPQDYTVKLTITEDDSVKTLINQNYIHVTELDPPVAGFTHNLTDNSACLPVSVTFTDASTGTITDSEWDFGDGGSSVAQNPIHVFAKAGYYLVRRIVQNADWEDVLTQLFYIRPRAPTVRIYVDSSSGVAPFSVSFIPVIIGAYNRLEWDFGDETTSKEINPTHIYSTPGTYAITLSVWNSTALYATTATITITAINPALLPTAAFTADITSGESPVTVTFTDTSINPISWLWDFGDDSTSTEQNPVHQYTAQGTYTVSLTVTNTYGADIETKTGYIIAGADPIADFSADSDINYLSHSFQFTDESLYIPTSWLWDFGDGDTSTDQNPIHTYTSVKSYWVTLTVTNIYGTSTLGMDIVVVPENYPLPIFTYSTLNNKAPYDFTFLDASTGTPTSWLWDFGDGSTSTDQNPTHTYLFPGTYVVTLTVTNANGTASTTEVVLDDN